MGGMRKDHITKYGTDRSIQRLPYLRWIVPDSTTTEDSKLQQAWQDLATGEILWLRIDKVVVTDDEFKKA